MVRQYKEAYSEKLLPLTHECSECDATLTATGKMYYDSRRKYWLIEYWCPHDRELFRIWSANRDALTRAIAQDFVLDELPTV